MNNNFLYTQGVTICNKDVTKETLNLPANIDLCVTKLPIRKVDGFSMDFMGKLAKELKSKMSKNGLVFLICYAPTECKARPFEISKAMTDEDFIHVDNIIVEKTWVSGKRKPDMLCNSHEFALFFSKTKNWQINKKALKDYLGFSDDEFLGNNWLFDSGLLKESIPRHLPEALMRMTCNLPGSLVVDPFMSNKATLEAALKLGFSFWGCEKNPNRIKEYKKVILKHKEEMEVYNFLKNKKNK
jgi:hypothetical protein